MLQFSSKDTVERIYYGINFAALLAPGEQISSATTTLRVANGTDPNVALMKSGNPTIQDASVVQLIIDGVLGCTYVLAIEVTTTAGQLFVESGEFKLLNRD
jgi:hypothetical protein